SKCLRRVSLSKRVAKDLTSTELSSFWPHQSPTTKTRLYMTTDEHPVELAGVNLAGRNHVCAFFNTIDEEHRVLGSFYKDGLDRGEKPAHIVDPENREELRL